MAMRNSKISFIGSGHITEIILENLCSQGLGGNGRFTVTDLNAEQMERLRVRFGVETAANNAEAVKWADFIFINVPPLAVDAVITELVGVDFCNKVIVTLAAGVNSNRYNILSTELAVVRALPNPPSQIGQGVVALAFNEYVTPLQREEMIQIFSPMGECVLLSEPLINAVTSLSSPASVYLFFQSLIDAGVLCGLNRETSTNIAYHTIMGSMELLRARKVPAHDMLAQAATPGGTSVETLFTMEKRAFRAAVLEGIRAGAQKAESLGQTLNSK